MACNNSSTVCPLDCEPSMTNSNTAIQPIVSLTNCPKKIVTIENTASAVYLISFVYEILSEDYLRKLLNKNCIIVERVDRVMDAS